MAGFKTQSLLLRTAMLLLVFQSILAAQEGGRVSCMTKYLTQSGVIISDAAAYESSFGRAGLTIPKLKTTNALLLSFAMGGKHALAKNLQQCLEGKLHRCQSFYPCSRRGMCFLNHQTTRYACKCPPGQTGKFCQKAINECASNPCLNGGRCRDGVNMFTCSCRLGYEGTRCQTKWLLKSHHKPVPAALNKLQEEVRAIERGFKKLSQNVSRGFIKHNQDISQIYSKVPALGITGSGSPLDASRKSINIQLSNGGHTAFYKSAGAHAFSSAVGRIGYSRGRWQWRIRVSGVGNKNQQHVAIGVTTLPVDGGMYRFSPGTAYLWFDGQASAGLAKSQTKGNAKISKWQNGDVLTLTLDCDNQLLHLYLPRKAETKTITMNDRGKKLYLYVFMLKGGSRVDLL